MLPPLRYYIRCRHYWLLLLHCLLRFHTTPLRLPRLMFTIFHCFCHYVIDDSWSRIQHTLDAIISHMPLKMLAACQRRFRLYYVIFRRRFAASHTPRQEITSHISERPLSLIISRRYFISRHTLFSFLRQAYAFTPATICQLRILLPSPLTLLPRCLRHITFHIHTAWLRYAIAFITLTPCWLFIYFHAVTTLRCHWHWVWLWCFFRFASVTLLSRHWLLPSQHYYYNIATSITSLLLFILLITVFERWCHILFLPPLHWDADITDILLFSLILIYYYYATFSSVSPALRHWAVTPSVIVTYGIKMLLLSPFIDASLMLLLTLRATPQLLTLFFMRHTCHCWCLYIHAIVKIHY